MKTLKQAAEELEIHTETMRAIAIKKGIGCKVAGMWRFDDHDLEQAKEKQCQSGSGTASITTTFRSVESEYAELLEQANAN